MAGDVQKQDSWTPEIESTIDPQPNSASLRSTTVVDRSTTHRLQAKSSVQALVVDDEILIAGLEGGDIVVWSLETYELLGSFHAHESSVLGLCLSADENILFSSGADSVVKIWSTETFECLYSLHSYFEIGDAFSLAYSANLRTIFCGSQNASIQWYEVNRNSASAPVSPLFPGGKKHRFFDSLGPGGAVTAIPSLDGGTAKDQLPDPRRKSTFGKKNYLQYAHKSYIYCMLVVKALSTHDAEEEMLATGGGDGTIKLWILNSLSSKGPVQSVKFKNPNASVYSMAYSGSFLYAGLSDGFAHVYSLESRQLIQRLKVHCGDVNTIQIIEGVGYYGTSQGWVKTFNSQFSEIGKWHSNNGKILASATIKKPGRDLFVAGGNDNSIAIWDITDNPELSSGFKAHDNDELLKSLREFVAYRTVASNPKYVGDCHEAATFLRRLFNVFRARTTLLATDQGLNPILLAKFDASKRPESSKTLLFYGHYDVVDVEESRDDETGKWLSSPFHLRPLNGYLYGRGVTDNKGPILAALYAAADLVRKKELSCNIVFLLEGEEEAGSRGFIETVQRHHDRIGKVDFILLSNSYWLDDHIPCLTFGMRGVIHATVTISSGQPDRHSGMDGKSKQHEPLKDLTVLLSTLTGRSGTEIKIPNFQEAVSSMGTVEKKHYAGIAAALLPGHLEIKDAKSFADSLMERWREPSLTVHRIEVPESKKAVTISHSARATLSIRIVPNQKVDRIAKDLTEFLRKEFGELHSSNQLQVAVTSKADAWLGDPTNQIFQALESAITDVWSADPSSNSQRKFSDLSTDVFEPPAIQRRSSSLTSKGSFTPENVPRNPLYIREGGSIPAISFLEREFAAPAAMFPMGQASDNAHLNNERMRVENLYKGREVLKIVFSAL